MGTTKSKFRKKDDNMQDLKTESQTRDLFTDTEVAQLLERQREYFEQKHQKDTRATQLQAQNVAGSSSSPVSPSNAASPTYPNVAMATSSFSHPLFNSPAPPGHTLYPNLNTVQSQYQFQSNVAPPPSTSAEYVFVNNSGNIQERNVPVPTAPPAPRDRSISRDRHNSRPRYRKADKEKGSVNEMTCPTCKKMFGLTIFQCSRGHSSCNECKQFRRVCGICHQPITDMRNIDVEAVISEMKVKCPYSDDGCHLFIKRADLEKHSKECLFREMLCPLNSSFGCQWKGKLSQIESHFDNTHPINRGAVDTEMTISNLRNNSHNAHLVVIGNFNFMFHFIVSHSRQNVCMAVQLIGTNISASKWTYEIHVYNKGQPRRKYQHVDVCQPVNISVHDVISESKCAILPLSYASTFATDNKLTYKFYIKKEVNEKPFGRNNRGARGGQGR
ncbi:E3 ubiquitin-protein ligase Siah1-like isoform X2 [Plodia interpunctella]|uniref:E3 ubiquitin-protein ligase Siah1-like isoform X2 n=1 Tax=Plodia interpunctella TaxID=58824 RepID=UPI002367956E|nr:E3 ubiquitin-protein ligase Siah1-like isoform X2 [Plodia interpunctella]